MEEMEIVGAWISLFGLAWAVTVIIVTFKVWAACNRVAEMKNQLHAMTNDNRAAATAIHAELQTVSRLLGEATKR